MNPLILWAEKCYPITAPAKKKFFLPKWSLLFILLFPGLTNYAQAPGGVSGGLQAWYKADAGTTVSGSTVTGWKDQSGNGFNTTQGSYTGPTLTNAACNYNPGLTFASSGNYLQRAAPGIFTSGATYNNLNFYCVYNTSDGANFKWLTYQGTGAGYSRFSQSMNYSSTPTEGDMDFTTTNRLSYTTTGRLNVPVIVSYLGSTTAISGTSKLLLYLNGGAISNSTSYTPFTGPNNPFEIGNHVFTTGDPAAPFIGNIHEMIVYSGANSITQKQQIESYLAVKYGDTLNRVGCGGNYLNSSGASIFNDGGVATYWNNIIGIARDDNSGLSQKQSHQLDDSARLYLSTLQTTNAANTGTFSSNNQFVMLGNNDVSMANTGSTQYPTGYGILGRMGREWQITNTGFTGTYSIDIKVPASVCTIDPTQLMLIAGSSSNLTTANVYTASSGLTFSYSGGVITIGNISTSIIPLNSTQYFTLNMNAASVGGTVSSAQTICPGSTPSNLTIAGNTGSVINWQYSTDNFVSSINNIASSASTTLTSGQMGALSVNTYYRAVVQNGACSSAYSSTVLITMNSGPTISSITASPATFCSTGSSNLVVTATGTSSTTATIVNYNFNSGTSYATLTPTLATNVTSIAGGSASFNNTNAGTATGGSAFTSNTAGKSLYATNTGNYWTFTLGGSALSSYSSFAVYFQAERTSGSSSTFTLAYSTNGGSSFTTAGTLTLSSSGTWYQGLFTSLPGTDFPTSGLIFKITTNSNDDVQLDNFEVQAVQQTTTYSWIGAPSGTAGLPGTAGSALTTNDNITVNPTDTTDYTVTVSNGNGCSQTGNVTVNVNPLSVGGAVNSNATVCSGTNSGTLTLTGNTGSVVKWQYSTNGGSTWTDIANTTSSQTYSNITVATQYRAVVQSGVCSSAYSSVATISINSVSVGGAVNSSATVCSDSNSGTLNLTGQTGSVVKWQSSADGGTTWTDIVNTTTSQTYSNITLTTQYRAVVQSGVCSSANSSAATITVSPVSVGGAVNSSAIVCSGSNSGTLNLTGNTGSVVKWQSSTNGGSTWTDIANTTTSQTYTNITLTTQYRTVVQSGVCSSANSSAATITVNPVSVGGAVNSNATVCSGTNSGTVYLTGQTGNVVEWQSSTDGGSTWANIANTTTSQAYSNLTQTTMGRAVVQSGVCASVNSSTVTITVNSVSVGGAVNSSAIVCSGTNSGTLNLTGNNGNVVEWQSSTDGGSTWTNIANTTTSQAYSNITLTTQYRAVVQSGVCSSANSSAATVTVNPVSLGGTVNSNATVCSGSNSGTVYLTGQTGNLVKWQSSIDGGTTWTDIANTTSSQIYSNITQTTQYRAVVQSGVCSTANSSAATITVNSVSVGGSVNSSATVCSGSNSGTLNLTGQTGNVVKWQSSADGGTTWTDIANTTTSLLYSNLTQTTQYLAVVQSGVCSSANSSVATITVNPLSIGGSVNSNVTVCSGSNSGTVYLTGQTGNVVEWQYSTDGGSTWTNITNTTTSQAYTNLTQTTMGRAVVQSGSCATANSNPVTITVNSAPYATISYSGTPFCSTGGSAAVTQTGTPGGNYSSTSGLSLNSSTGAIDLSSSTPGNYTITYSFAAGVCAAYSTTTNLSITQPGSWIGAVSTDWNDTRNWLCGQIPTSAINVMISTGAPFYPNISSGIDYANNVTIQSGGSLTVAGGDLQIFGAITNNSGIFDATAGTIEMIGASAQTIDGSAFYNNTINNLIVSNTGSGLSVSSTTSDTLKITGTLTFGNSGSTLNTGDNITLVSNSAATASVGIVGSGNTINGNVTVERYINVGTAAGQHAKSWQFLATPTIGQTVKQSWMENGTTPVGYGTQITGAGGTAAGFDAYTASPSLKYYTPASNSWTGVTGTGISIYNPEGYMVFVRGDRSVTSVSQPANTTTLRTKGALLTGTLSPISVNPDEYASVGNPYASPVDFTLITKGAAIDDQFYVWDPYLYGSYGVGGYQTLSSANEFKPVPGGTSAYPSGTPYYILQSGQAIFVHSTSNPSYTAPDYNLTFSENSKSNSTSANFSRMSGLTPPPSSRAFFGVSLYTGNTIADGNTVAFDRSFSDNVDGNDALKLINGGENFGLKRDGKLLAIEARSPAVVTDTLYYYMTNLQQKAYQLRFAPVNMVASGLQAFLVDNFLNTSTPVSLSDSSFINITVTSNPASSASGRFDVVFRTLSITPVTFTSISAVQKNADIEVDWSVENETGIQQYEVEESGDGNQFTQVATVAPQNNGSGNYSWLDVNVTPGYHYYRVRSVGMDGQVQYTQIVKVLIGKMDASFSVYPNPIVNGNIHLAFNNEPAGVYGVRLMNSLGQLIFLKIINHGGGNSMEEITPSQTLAKGIYQLEITKPDGNVEVVKLIN